MLLVMIVYCIILNKRLKAFRNVKEEMADIIVQLNTSTGHAQRSIAELKKLVVEEEKNLSEKLKEASDMADELDMINQTGSNLADRIEKGLTSGRKGSADKNVSSKSGGDEKDDKISLSDLDEDEAAGEDNSLRESLRNVR